MLKKTCFKRSSLLARRDSDNVAKKIYDIATCPQPNDVKGVGITVDFIFGENFSIFQNFMV